MLGWRQGEYFLFHRCGSARSYQRVHISVSRLGSQQISEENNSADETFRDPCADRDLQLESLLGTERFDQLLKIVQLSRNGIRKP